MSFVHLHNHSEFSVLDGMVKVKDLASRAAELGMPAVALTDHGTMSGSVDFYRACLDVGVKPIIGIEAYLEPDLPEDGKRTQHTHHITLLASSDVGYRNLIKLSSYAYLENFYYKPRITQDLLFENNEGIICLSGCIQSQINHYFRNNMASAAKRTAAEYKEVFGDRYFIEVHNHNIAEETEVRPQLVDIARSLDIPLVAANDVHFLRQEDHVSHDILICIGTGRRHDDHGRMKYSPELYFKTAPEMKRLFRDIPDACENTIRVAEMCDFEMNLGVSKYPRFPVPENCTPSGYLEDLCFAGLQERYIHPTDEQADRLVYELSVINKTGFVDYFLVVWDFIRYARESGIPVGAGRGSAAGSLVAYCLGITDVDPLRFGLLFERFLNPDRISPPDIDIDFCMERRPEIIQYVRERYGDRCVSQITTYNTLGARSALRDVGRVMGVPLSDVDRLAKSIPEQLGVTLEQAEENEDVQTILNGSSSGLMDVWEHAKKLEGLKRNAGVHAAGIVISDRPLDEYVPLCRDKDGRAVSQYTMNPLGDLGLLKMDFLGLKTLTVIEETVRLIQAHTPGFRLQEIPLDDKKAFGIYNRGETLGVFQMEGRGITGCCRKFGVDSIDDIVAIGALFRPGPMQFIDDYIMRKRGYKDIEYAHPLLKTVCSDTYGIMVYQEQVQKAANVLAGYSLGEADLLRRAMGKKKVEEMAKERVRFVEGCRRVNGIEEDLANEIFDWISEFAKYGFNKSHSVAYGWISYQTAYLKAHYPTEFMSAMLTHDAQDIERLAQIIYECRRMSINVLPPDIHTSGMHFCPVDGCIRYGLLSIKNVGGPAVQSILLARENRQFDGLLDLCLRIDLRVATKKTLENMIMAGAMDAFGLPRAQMVASLEGIMKQAKKEQKKGSTDDQWELFDRIKVLDTPFLVSVPEWSMTDRLAHEKDVLGFYCTGHPLEEYASYFRNPKITAVSNALEIKEYDCERRLAGLVVKSEKKTRKSDGTPFAIVTLEDFTGQIELLAWKDTFTEQREFFEEGRKIIVLVKLKRTSEGVRAMINKVGALRRAA